MDLKEYNGYQFSTSLLQSGKFLAEGFDNGGTIVYGFGATEEDSVDDLKIMIDEYRFSFEGNVD